MLVSKVPHVLGPASLELKKPQQAVSDFEPGIRYRGFALGEDGGGALQRRTTAYACWEPRAPARFDKAAAKQTYEKLLDIWKTADPDFIPAQEARKEFAALNALKN